MLFYGLDSYWNTWLPGLVLLTCSCSLLLLCGLISSPVYVCMLMWLLCSPSSLATLLCDGVTEADHDGVRGHGGKCVSVTEMKMFHGRSVKVP